MGDRLLSLVVPMLAGAAGLAHPAAAQTFPGPDPPLPVGVAQAPMNSTALEITFINTQAWDPMTGNIQEVAEISLRRTTVPPPPGTSWYDPPYLSWVSDMTSVTPSPVPGIPGSFQTHIVSGLEPGTTYYLVTQALGGTGWGPPSLPVSAPTSTDFVPPAAVANLQASSAGASGLLLSWHVPGDDGMNGRATRYRVRYATTDPLSGPLSGWLAAATEADDPPVPAPPDTDQAWTLPGLDPPGTLWHVLVVAIDEVGNAGPPSAGSFASATTSMSDPAIDGRKGADYGCLGSAGPFPAPTGVPSALLFAWILPSIWATAGGGTRP